MMDLLKYIVEDGKYIVEDGIKYEVITTINGSVIYYLNDLVHRELGPAIVYYGGCEIWKNLENIIT